MTREELRNTFDAMTPDEAAKARMLDNILAAAEETPPRRAKNRIPRILALAASLLVVIAAVAALRHFGNVPVILPPVSESSGSQSESLPPASESSGSQSETDPPASSSGIPQSSSEVSVPESSAPGLTNPDIGGPDIGIPEGYEGDDAPCIEYIVEFPWGDSTFVALPDTAKDYPKEVSADAVGDGLDMGGVDCYYRTGGKAMTVSAIFYAVKGYDTDFLLALEFVGWEGRYFLFHPLASADRLGLTLGDFAEKLGLRGYAVTGAQETIYDTEQTLDRRYSAVDLPGFLDILLADGSLTPSGGAGGSGDLEVTLTRSDGIGIEVHLYIAPDGMLRIRCDTQNEWYEIGADRARRAIELVRSGMDCVETLRPSPDANGGDEMLTNPQ